MTRTDLPAAYIDRLAELVRLTRNGYGGEPWNIPGIKKAISAVQDTGAAPLDICCVALTSAADTTMRTPALMAQSGRQWTPTTTGRPQRPKCQHGHPLDTTPGATTSSVCRDCQQQPGFVDGKTAGLKDQMLAARELKREELRAEQAQQQALRDAAKHEAARKKAQRLDAARAELHQGDKP